MRSMIASAWALVGITALLGSAIWRLGRVGLEALSAELGLVHWAGLAFSVAFLTITEGYRGFQLGFSPRFAARLLELHARPKPLRALLAPLFCMGFFHARRRRLVVTYSLTAGIISLIVLVRLLSQPWRGIVDIGVVGGLAWGLVTLYASIYRAFTDSNFSTSPELPEGEGA